MNDQNFTSANADIEKSTHRLFITSIITLVYGILFMALMIYALNHMSIFSVGLDYYLLPGSTKMLIHFFHLNFLIIRKLKLLITTDIY